VCGVCVCVCVCVFVYNVKPEMTLVVISNSFINTIPGEKGKDVR